MDNDSYDYYPSLDSLDTDSEKDEVTEVPILIVIVKKMAQVNNSDTGSCD